MILAAAVVGSGIMATNLTSDAGLQLLINSIATVFILIVLITIFISISGAHFNPIVTLVQLLQNNIDKHRALNFWVAQFLGCSIGVMLANIMFDRQIIQVSEKSRDGVNLLIAELVATFGVILVIRLLADQDKPNLIPVSVSLWIGSAYFFTSSTSFANPAITFARSLTNSFAGIHPSSVLPFISFQLLGGLGCWFMFRVFGKKRLNNG